MLRLGVIKFMVSRHGLEALGHLIAAQRPAKRVQVRRVAVDQQLSDSVSVGERTGREYATQVRLDDPVSAQDARTGVWGTEAMGRTLRTLRWSSSMRRARQVATD